MYGNNGFSVGKILALIGGAVLVVFFFLPWYGPFAGYDAAGGSVLLWLCLIAGIAIVGAVLLTLNRDGQTQRTIGLVVVVLSIVAAFPPIYEYLRSQQTASAVTMLTGITWGIGFWGTLVACVVALVGGLMEYTTQPSYPPPPPPGPTEPLSVPRPVTQQPVARPQKTEYMGKETPALAWLAVKSGEHAGHQWGLQQSTNIGRDGAACRVVFQDGAVSSHHARINLEGGQFYIYDLASTNGTMVNNRRIQKQLLYDNDTITIGHNTMVFKRA